MTFTLMLAIVGVLVAWSLAGLAIWQWGPGLRKRLVKCPLLGKRTTVLAEQTEAGFFCSYAGIEAVDIKHCSLLEGPPVLCGKECLQHL
jgi:hypothetical protein